MQTGYFLPLVLPLHKTCWIRCKQFCLLRCLWYSLLPRILSSLAASWATCYMYQHKNLMYTTFMIICITSYKYAFHNNLHAGKCILLAEFPLQLNLHLSTILSMYIVPNTASYSFLLRNTGPDSILT